jgi:hypothetical protein
MADGIKAKDLAEKKNDFVLIDEREKDEKAESLENLYPLLIHMPILQKLCMMNENKAQ